MCGLVFLYEPGSDHEEIRNRVTAGLNRLEHRGPDERGIEFNAGACLGHQRLSIIDLSESHQPMRDPSGRYTLVYNGEIYNYRELRTQLESKWTFRTSGDTEVLLAGLLLRGPDFLQKAEGMWAFLLWDGQEQCALMARDRMGKKPLYYQLAGHGLSCASELPALRCLSNAPWHEDDNSTADYLKFGYYLPGRTAYSEIREILPGHYANWSPLSGIDERPYWSINCEPFSGSPEQAKQHLEECLHRSIERRLVADVEVGAMLSGGIDSSLLVSYLSCEFGIKAKTFTIGFDEPSFDERDYARIVADTCKTEHHVEVVDSWDPELLKTLVTEHIGQPFADSSILPTAIVSRLAGRFVKVAISGDGADELFSGYQRYQARAILRWYTRLPKLARGGIEKIISSLPEPVSHHSRSILKKAHLFKDVAQRIELETPYVAPVYYSQENFAALVPELHQLGHQPPGLPEQCQPDDVKQMMAADALIYLPQDILLKVDRASMAFSIETRSPFLDSNLIRLAFSLPRSWHRRGKMGKRMLRETFGHFLPEPLWQRRKQGFAVPVHQWFRGHMGDELLEMLARIPTALSATTVRQLLDQHRRGIRDHGYRLWNLYIYLLWKEHL